MGKGRLSNFASFLSVFLWRGPTRGRNVSSDRRIFLPSRLHRSCSSLLSSSFPVFFLLRSFLRFLYTLCCFRCTGCTTVHNHSPTSFIRSLIIDLTLSTFFRSVHETPSRRCSQRVTIFLFSSPLSSAFAFHIIKLDSKIAQEYFGCTFDAFSQEKCSASQSLSTVFPYPLNFRTILEFLSFLYFKLTNF